MTKDLVKSLIKDKKNSIILFVDDVGENCKDAPNIGKYISDLKLVVWCRKWRGEKLRNAFNMTYDLKSDENCQLVDSVYNKFLNSIIYALQIFKICQFLQSTWKVFRDSVTFNTSFVLQKLKNFQSFYSISKDLENFVEKKKFTDTCKKIFQYGLESYFFKCIFGISCIVLALFIITTTFNIAFQTSPKYYQEEDSFINHIEKKISSTKNEIKLKEKIVGF